MADRYRVALHCSHPEDIASGASFGPGETAVGVDPKHPHDKAAIEDGRLELIPVRKNTNKEASK